MAEKPSLIVHGMHGLGDNLHQRAVLRLLMETNSVYVETSWVSLYHDLIAQGLHVMHKPTRLRTQAKNAAREDAKFWRGEPPPLCDHVSLRYSRSSPSTIMEEMLASAGLAGRFAQADYSLPVAEEWFAPVEEAVASWHIPSDKPVMVYRPLTIRPEWMGSERRNADVATYAEALMAIRHRYFVISIADLVPSREWIVGPEFTGADVVLHKGELPFESLAALFALSDLVFTSGGFALILGSAVHTPVISIVEGESPARHSDAARYAPYLGIKGDAPAVVRSVLRFSDSLDHGRDGGSDARQQFSPPAASLVPRHMAPRRIFPRRA